MSEKRQALEALAQAQWRLALSLTAAMMAIYLGFMLLIAWAKPLLGTMLAVGLGSGFAEQASAEFFRPLVVARHGRPHR